MLNKWGKTISMSLWMLIRLATLLKRSISCVSKEIPSGDLRSPFSMLLSIAISTILL